MSIVSSGDETPSKDYVHPRANLMAALGRASRGPEPLAFVTELAAFFAYRAGIMPEDPSQGRRNAAGQAAGAAPAVLLRSRAARVRGGSGAQRRHSGVEAYAFLVDPSGNVTKDDLR